MRTYTGFLAALALIAACTTPAMARHHHQAAQAVPANANLSGMRIYSPKGSYVGTVLSMSKTKTGKPAAVMLVEKRLGIGTVKVLLPTGQLKPRKDGGYYADMTRQEARGLPKA